MLKGMHAIIAGLAIAILVLIGAFTSTVSHAQVCMDQLGSPAECTPEVDASYNTKGLAQRAADQLKAMINTVESQIDSIRTKSPFVALGKKIIGVLGMLVITWAVIKGWITKPGATQIVADLVFPFIIMGLAIASLDTNLGQLVADSVSNIATTMTSTGGTKGTSSQIFAENMIKSMAVIWDAPNEGALLTLGVGVIMAGLLKLVAIFFIAAATAAGVAILLMAKFQIALAIALGPVMIPWAIWKPTEFIFSGWLTFLLKGGFMSIAVYTIESTLRATSLGMANLAASVAPGVDSAMTYGVIALMSMLFALLMSKASDIGAGLISGGASGFSGFHAVTHGGAAAASRGTGAATSAALTGGAGLVAARAMGAMVAGRRDGDLSGLHKAMRPKEGASRIAYEMGRKA